MFCRISHYGYGKRKGREVAASARGCAPAVRPYDVAIVGRCISLIFQPSNRMRG